MKSMLTCLAITGWMLFCALVVRGQDADTIPLQLSVQQINAVTESLRASANTQIAEIENQWQIRTNKIKKQEEKLLEWLQQTDKQAADALGKLDGPQLAEITNRWKNGQTAMPYIARMDTLKTLLGFHGNLQLPQVAEADALVKRLQSTLGGADEVGNWLQQRQTALFEALRRQGNLPPDIARAFDRWKGEAAVWKAQVAHYKEVVNSPERIEREALKILQRQPFFQQFMAKHGELARLFGPPAGADPAGAGNPIPGLQTRAGLMQELQNRFGQEFTQNGGMLQQQLQEGMDEVMALQNPIELAKKHLEDMKNKISSQLSPADQEKAALKALPIKQRFEIGWNLQTNTSLHNFPAMTDAGLSLGYKLSPRLLIGTGAAYKFGLGESFRKLRFTHEGLGLRSFTDWRLFKAHNKYFKNLWLTSGYEMNYSERMNSSAQVNRNLWIKSAVFGITRRKGKGTIQVLYTLDFVDNYRNQNFTVRFGKTLNNR